MRKRPLRQDTLTRSVTRSPPRWQQRLSQALQHHQAGQLDAARSGYRQVLRDVPEQPDALHLLGVVALQSGRLAEAETSIRAALAVTPTQATYWNSLGATQRATGRLAEAAASFERAVSLLPTYPDPWSALADVRAAQGDAAGEALALERVTILVPNHAPAWGRRGVLAYQAGRPAEAVVLLQTSVDLQPGDADALSNLGAVQLVAGQTHEAEASLRQALTLVPGHPMTLNNLGTALVAQSRWEEAAATLQQVVAVSPDDPNGWTNLGHALKGLERHSEAAAAYERALSVHPDLTAALVGLGDALQGQEEYERALPCYDRALALTPDDPQTLDHRGVALKRLDRLEEAVVWFERSLASRPDSVETWDHLASTLQQLGRLHESVVAHRRSLELAPDRPDIHSTLIFLLDLLEDAEDEAVAERRRWNARFGRPEAAITQTRPTDPRPDRPLRVGYVSADFMRHSSVFATLPVVESHDHTRFTVVCYSGVTTPDPITERFRAAADLWRDTTELSDDDLVAQIKADQIDILVDLSGFTNGNRLTAFAHRPAPVQLTAWGYANGTGLDAIQYLLSDPIITPPAARLRHSEEVVDLPSVICYLPTEPIPPVAPAPLTERGYVTFGAFNRLPKLSTPTLEAWAAVMRAVPDARLLLKAGQRGPDPARDRVLATLQALGVAPGRIEVRGNTPHYEHLTAHAEADLMLDAFPHAGGITTLDALLMGVPVVTLVGKGVSSRSSASFLTTLGLTDLIAPSVDAYVTTAVRWAADPDRLVRERASLRDRLLASPIGDVQRYTRSVEDVYRELWRRRCSQSIGAA